MKIVISFLSMLLIVTNSVLLLFQYHVYSSGLEEEGQVFLYEQEIEMKFQKDKIIIKQHFSNLPKEQMTISWPISSENRSCELTLADSCNRISEDLVSFMEGETTKQSISYEIPLVDGLQDGQSLTGFLAKIEKGNVSNTALHLTDEVKRGGMWISGLPIIGNASLELIDYTMFLGKGSLSELYWQKDAIPVVYENEHFTVHSNEKLSEDVRTLLVQLDIPNSEHITALFADNKQNIKSSRIAFIQNKDISSIERELIVKNVQAKYGLSLDNPLIAEVLSSFLMDYPIGSEKSKWMYETLKDYFTDSQFSDWKSALLKNKKLNAEQLDKMLSKIIDYKTSFFVLNEQYGVEHYPLLMEDSRTVFINELQQEKMSVVYKEGKVLFAAEPLLTELGYTLNNTDKGLYVQNATRAFRFPIQEPFYVLNEKRYDAMSEPFERIGAELYIEEAWMIRLFLLNVEKEEKRINISQSAQF